MDDTQSGAPLAYSIKEAIRATSLGRTRLYQLIAAGRLEAIKIGNRTLIPAPALHKLLKGDSPAAGKGAPKSGIMDLGDLVPPRLAGADMLEEIAAALDDAAAGRLEGDR